MTSAIAATSLLREAIATTQRIAALANADATNNAADEHRRADAIYDLACAADRVLATYCTDNQEDTNDHVDHGK